MELCTKVVWRRGQTSADGKPFPSFVSLAVGKPFDLSDSHLILGTPHGSLLFVPIFSKSSPESDREIDFHGASISSICLTQLMNAENNDILVGDTHGNLFTISNGVTVATNRVGHPISRIAIHRDQYDNLQAIVGDMSGTITSIKPLIQNEKEFSIKLTSTCMEQAINGVLSVSMPDLHGVYSNYILISNKSRQLIFYSQGMKAHEIIFPSNITSICSGHFSNNYDNPIQIAVSCDNGIIYLLDRFEISEFYTTGLKVTSMQSIRNIPLKDHSINSKDVLNDILLCSGNFDRLLGIQSSVSGAKISLNIPTSDWVSELHVSQLEKNGMLHPDQHIILGLMDNTIEVHQLCRERNV